MGHVLSIDCSVITSPRMLGTLPAFRRFRMLSEEIILNNAIGKKNTAHIKKISGVMMIPTTKEGKISKIIGLESAKKIKYITNIDMTAFKGQEIKKLPRNLLSIPSK